MTTEQTQAPSGSRRSVLLDFLGSMNLAITFLVIIAIASVIGTVLQQNKDYADYIIKFGPFWHEFYKTLGLYDVYGALWFLLLLAFLVTSTSVCIYRNVPTMLHEMRNFRLNSQLKNLRTMENARTWPVELEQQSLIDRLSQFLRASGYQLRQKQHDDRLVIAGMRGKFNRMGYLLAHMGIVVICLGAFLDAKFDLTLREWLGTLKVDNTTKFVKDMPPESTLKPGGALSFRGRLELPEGQTGNFALITVRDGILVQYLPFAIELKDFRVEQYETGQPKSFESDLIIHDDQLKEPLTTTIAVNHPLTYRGYNIYQASFGDGGSKLNLKIWPFYDAKLRTIDLDGTVRDQRSLDTAQGPMTLEFADFKKFNVFPAPKDDPRKRKFENFGPSMVFRVRDSKGTAKEYVNYMSPVEMEGRFLFITGVRGSVAEDYRYIHIPADDKYTIERFMKFHALLNDTPRITEIARRTAQRLLQQTPVKEADREKLTAGISKGMMDLLDQLLYGGTEAIQVQVAKQTTNETERANRYDAYLKVLTSLLQAVYFDVLKDEGVKSQQDITKAQERFYVDALEALRQIYLYGSPFYVQLTDFKHVQQSTLEITRSPGKNVVYLGCVMLIAGVFLLFYISHQRLWLVLYRDEAGKQQLLFAGSGNRNVADFHTHYEALANKLDSVLKL